MEIQNTKDATNDFINIVVHGPSGVGKTRLALTIDEPTIILNIENGLASLRGAGIDYLDVKRFDDLYEVYGYLNSGEHEYKWLFIDSLSEAGEMCFANAMTALKEEAARNNKNVEPRQAYGKLMEQMIPFMKAIRDLPMNTVSVCKQERIKDEATGLFIHGPLFPGNKVGQQVPYLYDITLAMHAITQEDGSVQTVFQTARDDNYDAKDRYGVLPAMMPASIGEIQRLINA